MKHNIAGQLSVTACEALRCAFKDARGRYITKVRTGLSAKHLYDRGLIFHATKLAVLTPAGVSQRAALLKGEPSP